jgi:hypothetical protein
MLEYFLLKKLLNGNVVTLNGLRSLIPTPLHAKTSTIGNNAAGHVLIAHS